MGIGIRTNPNPNSIPYTVTCSALPIAEVSYTILEHDPPEAWEAAAPTYCVTLCTSSPATFVGNIDRQNRQGGGQQGRARVQAQAQGDHALLRQLPPAGVMMAPCFSRLLNPPFFFSAVVWVLLPLLFPDTPHVRPYRHTRNLLALALTPLLAAACPSLNPHPFLTPTPTSTLYPTPQPCEIVARLSEHLNPIPHSHPRLLTL